MTALCMKPAYCLFRRPTPASQSCNIKAIKKYTEVLNMEKIYQESVVSIQNFGTRFTIDFKKRNLKFNGKYIIKNAEYDGELGVEKCSSTEEFISKVEYLYSRYKNSIPSTDDGMIRKCYFKALREDELDEEDMWFGTSRNLARFELEMYILAQIIMGFEWNEELMGKWFWFSKSDNDLVLLKEWF